ncbi:PriCT-2 domain-containing protein, partial [Crocosphaera sp. UHCC 0190]
MKTFELTADYEQTNTELDYDQALYIVENNLVDPCCSREDWVKLGTAMKSAGLDFEHFDRWSQGSPDQYNAKNCQSTWNSLKENRSGIAYLVKEAKYQSNFDASAWTKEWYRQHGNNNGYNSRNDYGLVNGNDYNNGNKNDLADNNGYSLTNGNDYNNGNGYGLTNGNDYNNGNKNDLANGNGHGNSLANGNGSYRASRTRAIQPKPKRSPQPNIKPPIRLENPITLANPIQVTEPVKITRSYGYDLEYKYWYSDNQLVKRVEYYNNEGKRITPKGKKKDKAVMPYVVIDGQEKIGKGDPASQVGQHRLWPAYRLTEAIASKSKYIFTVEGE